MRTADLEVIVRTADSAISIIRAEACRTGGVACQTLLGRSIRVEAVGTHGETGEVEKEVILGACCGGAVFGRPKASHTDGTTRLTEIGDRRRDELSVGTRRVADSVADVLIIC